MPIFDFRCSQCGHGFELLVRAGESGRCPDCNSEKVEKLMSAPAAPSRMSSPLSLAGSCPPADAPPCSPGCCRLPR